MVLALSKGLEQPKADGGVAGGGRRVQRGAARYGARPRRLGAVGK